MSLYKHTRLRKNMFTDYSSVLQLLDGSFLGSLALRPNGSSTPADGKYCGTTAPVNMTTSSRYLTVVFSSDLTNQGAGFRFNYRHFNPCGGN